MSIKRDVRGGALNVLFDLIETQAGRTGVGTRCWACWSSSFPTSSPAGISGARPRISRESKLLKDRASNLRLEQGHRLEGFVNRLSEPAIVGQLLQSLDDASGLGVDQDAASVIRELRASALEPLVGWLPNLSADPLRKMLEEVIDKLAGANIAEVQRLLRQPESSALQGIIELCGRLQLHHAVPGFTEVIGHADPAVRLAAVQTLAQLGTPGALTLLDRAIDDADKAVRIAAVRGAGQRGLQGRAQADRGGRARQVGPKHGSHRKNGVLRGVRRYRRHRCAQIAQLHSASARPAEDEGAARNPRMRRHGAGPDQVARGARGSSEGGRRQGARGPQRGESRAPGAGDVSQPVPMSSGGSSSAPEGQLRQGGRALLLTLYAALESLKLYPLENATVQKSLDDLDAAARALHRPRDGGGGQVAGDFLFVNATRLRRRAGNYASFSHILAVFRAFDIGMLHLRNGLERRDWQIFLSLLLSNQRGTTDERLEILQER